MGEGVAEINWEVLIVGLKYLCRPNGNAFFSFLDSLNENFIRTVKIYFLLGK